VRGTGFAGLCGVGSTLSVVFFGFRGFPGREKREKNFGRSSFGGRENSNKDKKLVDLHPETIEEGWKKSVKGNLV